MVPVDHFETGDVMYVDLPANAVRYCFHTVADASAFKQRFGCAAERRAVTRGH
jgi:hypothetical protein